MNDAEIISKYASHMNELMDEHKKQIKIHKCHTCGKPSSKEIYILPTHIYLCEDCRPSMIHGITKASFKNYQKSKI
jgi:ribosomal protein L37AE/L43A